MISPFSFPGFLEEGNRAKIFCSVIKGDPPINIRWLKDGRPLTSSPLTGVSVSTIDEYSSAIVINKLTLGHRGNYTCIASNAASSSNFTALAVVYGELTHFQLSLARSLALVFSLLFSSPLLCSLVFFSVALRLGVFVFFFIFFLLFLPRSVIVTRASAKRERMKVTGSYVNNSRLSSKE